MSTYACTDLHGRKDLYREIKSLINPDDKIFFLGDAGDRGPDGWELIKSIYEDDQFVYLKGNHEDMLVDAARAYLRNPKHESEAYRLLKRNGGKKTIEDWWKDGEDEVWIDKIDALPLHAEYENQDGKLILMSHAGYTPWYDKDEPDRIFIPGGFELIWNRDHFYDNWNKDCFPNCIVVHGHTTIPHLMDYLCDKRKDIPFGAYWYCNKHKVCIDNLSALTGIACLLNLDTLESTTVEV